TATRVTLSEPLATAHPRGEILLGDERPPDCRDNPFSADGVALGYIDYSAVEIRRAERVGKAVARGRGAGGVRDARSEPFGCAASRKRRASSIEKTLERSRASSKSSMAPCANHDRTARTG